MHTQPHISDTLRASAEELRRLAEQHERLLERVTARGEVNCSQEICASLQCSCRRVLRETLTETINVLDDTRRAFKSKQLAELRKKLIATLAEHG
jgi:hypothetical protein